MSESIDTDDQFRHLRIVISPEPTEEERLALLMAFGDVSTDRSDRPWSLEGEDPSAPLRTGSGPPQPERTNSWTRIGREEVLRARQWPLQVRSWSMSFR